MAKRGDTNRDDHEYRFGIAGGSAVGQDLNQLLVGRPESTFYLRVATDQSEHNLQMGDILIVDRSLTPKRGSLTVITDEDSFKVARFTDKVDIWGTVTYIIHKTGR